jgi:hypothetical protein
VIDQTINLSAGAVEDTYPRTITETTGEDTSADPVFVALAPWGGALTWVAPSTLTRSTTTVAEYNATNPAELLALPDATVLHQTTVALLIGDTLKPAPGNFYLWTKVTDAPEVVPRMSPGRITIV